MSTDNRDEAQGPDLSPFWLANGFKPKHAPCDLLAPAQRRNLEQRFIACWERWYPGWISPYSGALFGREVWENGVFVVYVYSNHRETEAKTVAENLGLYLKTQDPGREIDYDEKCFVDVR